MLNYMRKRRSRPGQAQDIVVDGHTPMVKGAPRIVRVEVGTGRAPSYAVSDSGDKYYGPNRAAVLSRFGLVLCRDGVARPSISGSDAGVRAADNYSDGGAGVGTGSGSRSGAGAGAGAAG